MGQRRLFSQIIVESDAFLDMPISSQALYFHLCMHADDDGFVNPKKIMRLIGAASDDLNVLLTRRFVLPFKSGVIVIKHWLIHNTIRKDRYKETIYLEEKNTLKVKENGSYTELTTIGLPFGNQMAPQVKVSKVKVSKVKSSPEKSGIKEVVNYFFELKGWANKEKEFYSANDIRYAHHAKRAKELLDLCEGDIIEAKECIRKMSEWALSHELTWMIETIFKHWYDLDLLKPKDKKPYYNGCRIFKKSVGGNWYIVRNGEVKELGIMPKKEEIIYK